MSTLPVIAAVDGSDDSLVALDWAFDAALVREAPLRVVHVQQYAAWARPEVLPAGRPVPEDDPVLDRVRRYLDGRVERPTTEYVALAGVASTALPELGASAQLLVLGSRGRGGFASLLLGSNGMAVARDAGCPVVVVPKPGRDGGTSHAFRAVGDHVDRPIEPGPRVVVGLQVD
ncbi:universal stress protein, partial [Streptomyces sp. NPDC006356]